MPSSREVPALDGDVAMPVAMAVVVAMVAVVAVAVAVTAKAVAAEVPGVARHEARHEAPAPAVPVSVGVALAVAALAVVPACLPVAARVKHRPVAGLSDCKAVAAVVLPAAVGTVALLPLPHPRASSQGRQQLAVAASPVTEALLQAASCLDAAARRLRPHLLHVARRQLRRRTRPRRCRRPWRCTWPRWPRRRLPAKLKCRRHGRVAVVLYPWYPLQVRSVPRLACVFFRFLFLPTHVFKLCVFSRVFVCVSALVCGTRRPLQMSLTINCLPLHPTLSPATRPINFMALFSVWYPPFP